MATATIATKEELAKLSPADLTAKLNDEIKPRIAALEAMSSRTTEDDEEIENRLAEFDAIAALVKERKDSELKNRLDNVKKFDLPKPRRAGGSNGTENFASLGDRLIAVANAGRGGRVDQRLYNALGANESTPSSGGFFVGADEENDLMTKVYGSPILNLIPRTPISSASNSLKLRQLKEDSRADGSRQGGVQAYWGDEADTITASQRKYDAFSIELLDLFALSYLTAQLLEDAPALQAETSSGFQEEMTFKIEDGVVNGTGVGRMLGILNSPAKITVTAEVGQTSGQPLMYENIVNMWARLHPRSQTSCVWLVDQSLIPYLFTMGLTNGTAGTPVYLPPGGASGSPYGTLMGRPVMFTEYTKAANTEGDIILWDPQSYRIIEKGGIKEASSMDVAFLTNEMAFRWTTRINGAPKWRSALTPKNGGATLSTIVTLATRT